jgi:HEAT repeat protein
MASKQMPVRLAERARDARALLDVVRSSEDVDVAAYGIHGLGRLADPDVLPDLLAWLDGRSQERIVLAAALALRRFGDARAAPFLATLLADPEGPARYAAIESLEAIGGPAAVEALAAGFGDPDDKVRARTAQALGRVGGEGAVVLLDRALDDKAWYVRLRAHDALDAIGTSAAADAMERVLPRQRSAVRRWRLQRRIDRIRARA